jgi:hypothetical protein
MRRPALSAGLRSKWMRNGKRKSRRNSFADERNRHKKSPV